MKNDGFIDIAFNGKNLDRYIIRNAIKSAIAQNSHKLKGCLLDIGCGKMPYRDFIFQNSAIENYTGLDIEGALEYEGGVKPDYTWDGLIMPFNDNSFESAFATEVLEHCPRPDIILTEVNRVLKPGGCFFFTVPFLWPLHEVPNDEYRYTPFSLQRLLIESGFIDINIQATGGWHAALAQMLGLWVRRAPIGKKKRRFLSFILKPIIKNLIKKDGNSAVLFSEGQMVTGLSGIAIKK
jgi:SAM-dependent methyltransferase